MTIKLYLKLKSEKFCTKNRLLFFGIVSQYYPKDQQILQVIDNSLHYFLEFSNNVRNAEDIIYLSHRTWRNIANTNDL